MRIHRILQGEHVGRCIKGRGHLGNPGLNALMPQSGRVTDALLYAPPHRPVVDEAAIAERLYLNRQVRIMASTYDSHAYLHSFAIPATDLELKVSQYIAKIR